MKLKRYEYIRVWPQMPLFQLSILSLRLLIALVWKQVEPVSCQLSPAIAQGSWEVVLAMAIMRQQGEPGGPGLPEAAGVEGWWWTDLRDGSSVVLKQLQFTRALGAGEASPTPRLSQLWAPGTRLWASSVKWQYDVSIT